MERSVRQNIAWSMQTAMYLAYSLGSFLYLIEAMGCYNSIRFRERWNDRRIEVGLQPFVAGWEHEKIHEDDIWYNPVRAKQGLSCWYKSQAFDWNLLVMEADAWEYTEGDSVHFGFYHNYFFHRIKYHFLLPDSTNHDFHMNEYHEHTNDFLNRHGQSIKDSIAFAKTILFLRKRADSLQLNVE